MPSKSPTEKKSASVDYSCVFSTTKWNVVPWMDWHEWQEVRSNLFAEFQPSCCERNLNAIKRIAAWRARTENQLPIAVESSAQLIEVMISDQNSAPFFACQFGTTSYMQLSLTYASIITRTINGLVDTSQRGAYAISVSMLAKTIGIPLWQVDIRHEVTHNALPSLATLRFAAQNLLNWLITNYWQKQDLFLQNKVIKVKESVQKMNKEINDNNNCLCRVNGSMIIDNYSLNHESIRDIIIPLLIYNDVYGVSFDSCALTDFRDKSIDNSMCALDSATVIDWLHINYPKSFVLFIFELQKKWNGFRSSFFLEIGRALIELHTGNDVNNRLFVIFQWFQILLDNYLWNEESSFDFTSAVKIVYKKLIVAERKSEILDKLMKLVEKHLDTYDCGYIQTTTFSCDNDDTPWKKCKDWNACPFGSVPFDGSIHYNMELPNEADDIENGVFISMQNIPNSDVSCISSKFIDDMDLEYENRIRSKIAHKEEQALKLKIQPNGKDSVSIIQDKMSEDQVQELQEEIEIW